MNSLTRLQLIVSWLCRLIAAGILLQTLFFKFTGAEESVYIFTRVGLEPSGRYGSGVMELMAVVFLLTPRLVWAGALLAVGVMSGALLFHLTSLGIVVQDDGGLLFGLALTVFAAGATLLVLHRRQIPLASRLLKTQDA